MTERTLRDFPHADVRVSCRKCELLFEERRDVLMVQHGAAIGLPHLLRAITRCKRPPGDARDPCGAVFTDLG